MSAQPKTEAPKIPIEVSTRLRSLAHDLSNSLEAIMQASYLLSQAELDQNARRWADLIDQASQDSVRINREIRETLRSSS